MPEGARVGVVVEGPLGGVAGAVRRRDHGLEVRRFDVPGVGEHAVVDEFIAFAGLEMSREEPLAHLDARDRGLFGQGEDHQAAAALV